MSKLKSCPHELGTNIAGDCVVCGKHMRPPRWRHWHVTWHDVGYTLKEATAVKAHEDANNPEYGPYYVTRCDEDHSGTFVIAVG